MLTFILLNIWVYFPTEKKRKRKEIVSNASSIQAALLPPPPKPPSETCKVTVSCPVVPSEGDQVAHPSVSSRTAI